MTKLLTLRTLIVLAVMLVFVSGSDKIEAQKKKVPRVIEGTISNFECGDNCYLTITDKKGKEHTGLCTARPLCTKWNEETTMPDSYKGKRVKVTVGKGTRYNGGGDVVDKFDAFTKILLLTTPPAK